MHTSAADQDHSRYEIVLRDPGNPAVRDPTSHRTGSFAPPPFGGFALHFEPRAAIEAAESRLRYLHLEMLARACNARASVDKSLSYDELSRETPPGGRRQATDLSCYADRE